MVNFAGKSCCANSMYAAIYLVLMSCCLVQVCFCNTEQTQMSKMDSVTIPSLALSSTSSHSIKSRTSLSCLSRCLPYSHCLLIAFSKSSGLCEIVLTTEAGSGAYPAASVYTTTTGVIVWAANDFSWKVEMLLTTTPTTVPPFSLIFTATSTGRLGTIQNYVTPATGCYVFQGWGARGGNQKTEVMPGGYGAYKKCTYNLNSGITLHIVAGQRGGDNSESDNEAGTGGGGGSFVYMSDLTLLLAAGGGGGAAQEQPGSMTAAMKGNVGTSGGAAQLGGSGGTNGNPGNIGSGSSRKGGPGAGWNSKAPGISSYSNGAGGGGRVEDWVGGLAATGNSGAWGGFGGGGGGARSAGASGGGGGYSGGAASADKEAYGGGGGSYCASSAVLTAGTTGGNTASHGKVQLDYTGPAC